MCHQGDIPSRVYDNAYQTIVDDLRLRDGEPVEGTGPHPDFLEYNDPLLDLPEDLRDHCFLQELDSIWPARQESLSENQVTDGPPRLASCIKELFDQDKSEFAHFPEYSPFYNDYFLRRLHGYLPPKLDFDCWIAKLLIKHVADSHSIPHSKIHSSEDGTKLTYEAGFVWPHQWARCREQIASDLEAIPEFLANLALEYALWLPYEMQLISSVLDEESLDRYRQGFYSLLPRTMRPYSLNARGEIFNLCWMHARNFLGHGWLELPFTHEIEW
ncbi:MAG: hypothetical protein M1830_009062 [Pleopsidium flavum]|nr:MAG: hypothetical protein M1830_009062 [Pleopsidium flavum]